MKAVICGSRDVNNGAPVFQFLDEIHARTPITLVIEGGQRTRDKVTRQIVGGVDWFAHQWARAHGIECVTDEARWNEITPKSMVRLRPGGERYNSSAGPERNRRMANDYGADVCIAFWGGRGTASMVNEAQIAGLRIIEAPDDSAMIRIAFSLPMGGAA